MNYKEAIKEKIQEENCKNLWEEISAAYEQGVEEGIENILSKKADEIVNNFKDLLNILKRKF